MLVREIEHRIRTEGVLAKNHYPAAATPAVITLPPKTGRRHTVHFVQWSYSDTPTGGRLSITMGGVLKFDADITAGGPGGFNLYLVGGINEELVITLASGAGVVVGKLSAQVAEDAA